MSTRLYHTWLQGWARDHLCAARTSATSSHNCRPSRRTQLRSLCDHQNLCRRHLDLLVCFALPHNLGSAHVLPATSVDVGYIYHAPHDLDGLDRLRNFLQRRERARARARKEQKGRTMSEHATSVAIALIDWTGRCARRVST